MVRLLQGDALDVLRTLPAESVQCVVTSPPYWGLRDYGVPGQLGLEETPEAYVARLVEVFREVRRVLRRDGTCWLVLGDSYAGAKVGNTNGGASSGLKLNQPASRVQCNQRQQDRMAEMQFGKSVPADLKPKDLVGIPWRVAFALQADGWWLRSDVIWAKPNPMPESVTDRPTRAHEYVFLLTRAERYYYDAVAVWEASVSGHRSGQSVRSQNHQRARSAFGTGVPWEDQPGRNRRTVWTIASQPYRGAHFAVFPQKLVEPCILAGTSERGCCPECGAPWARSSSSTRLVTRGRLGDPKNVEKGAGAVHGGYVGWKEIATTGWRPTCDHLGEPVPCVVLDPFAGSGTALAVALRLGRDAIGIELNPAYLTLAEHRVGAVCQQTRLAV